MRSELCECTPRYTCPIHPKGYKPTFAPTFAELKELPKLRELAKMVTEAPCFTNAILAVTDAYKEGLLTHRRKHMRKTHRTDTQILIEVKNFLARFPVGTDEPIDGADAVDALNELAEIVGTVEASEK